MNRKINKHKAIKPSFFRRYQAHMIIYASLFSFVVNFLNNALLFKILIKLEDK